MIDVCDKRKNMAALLHVVLFVAVIVLNIIIAYMKINIATVFLSALTITFIAAFYLMSYKYHFLLVLFVICGLFSLTLFRNAESVLITVGVFIIAFEIVCLYRKKYERTRILVVTSVILLLFACVYYLTYGGVRSFGDILERVRADVDLAIENMRAVYVEYIGYESSDDPVQTAVDMTNIKKSLALFVPGGIIAIANIISFVITAVMRVFFDIFYRLTSYKRFFIDKTAWRIHLSFVSVALIPLTIMLISFSNADSNIIFLCIINSVNFLLMPAIFVIGVYFIRDYVADNLTRMITLAILAGVGFVIFPRGLYFIFVIAGMIKETRYYMNIIEEKIKSVINKDDDDFE